MRILFIRPVSSAAVFFPAEGISFFSLAYLALTAALSFFLAAACCFLGKRLVKTEAPDYGEDRFQREIPVMEMDLDDLGDDDDEKQVSVVIPRYSGSTNTRVDFILWRAVGSRSRGCRTTPRCRVST